MDFAGAVHAAAQRVLDVGGATGTGDRDEVAACRDEIAAGREQRRDRLDEAIELVRKALVAEPDNGAFLDSLGWAYYRKGDLGEAERYLGQAATRLPRNSEVQDHLGDVLAKRGRLPDAVDAWTRALEGDGTDIDRAEIQKKIDDARTKLRR